MTSLAPPGPDIATISTGRSGFQSTAQATPQLSSAIATAISARDVAHAIPLSFIDARS
jgi:hypothetical protein